MDNQKIGVTVQRIEHKDVDLVTLSALGSHNVRAFGEELMFAAKAFLECEEENLVVSFTIESKSDQEVS